MWTAKSFSLGGFAGGFVSGCGNAWQSGSGFINGLKMGLQNAYSNSITAGITNGVAQGIAATNGGFNFWDGSIYNEIYNPMVKIRVLFITILYISSVTGKSQLLFDNYSRIHSAVNNAIHLDGDILVNDEEYKKKLTSSLYSYWCYSYESTQRDMANKETMYIPYCFDFCINYKEKKYQLEFYRDTPPAESVTISAGTFSKQGEEFILKDRLNGHELRVKKIQDCFLYFSKGYFCFSKKLFGNYKKNQSKLSECNPDSSFLLSVNQSASIKRPIPYPTEGVYAYKSTMMVLGKDNLFSYYIDGVMLLKGCWEQKGNRLKLYDQTLKYNFYGKITPQGIQSVYLPGDREGVLLKKIKD